MITDILVVNPHALDSSAVGMAIHGLVAEHAIANEVSREQARSDIIWELGGWHITANDCEGWILAVFPDEEAAAEFSDDVLRDFLSIGENEARHISCDWWDADPIDCSVGKIRNQCVESISSQRHVMAVNLEDLQLGVIALLLDEQCEIFYSEQCMARVFCSDPRPCIRALADIWNEEIDEYFSFEGYRERLQDLHCEDQYNENMYQ